MYRRFLGSLFDGIIFANNANHNFSTLSCLISRFIKNAYFHVCYAIIKVLVVSPFNRSPAVAKELLNPRGIYSQLSACGGAVLVDLFKSRCPCSRSKYY